MAYPRYTFAPLGLVLDQPPELVPLETWTGGQNVTFQHGRSQRTSGAAEVWPGVVSPNHVAFTPSDDGNSYWTWANVSQITVTDGSTNFDITPAGGVTAVDGNVWTFDSLNGINVMNQPQGVPLYWGGSTGSPALPLPDFPANTTCNALRAYKFHLVALNLAGNAGFDQSYLRWSDAAAPGTVPQSWTIGVGSEAGDNVLGDEPGPLIDGKRLRDSLYLYKTNSVYSMDYVGGAEVFTFRQVFSDIGALALNCVADWKGQHIVLTTDDVVIHDGQSWSSIIDDRNRETLFAELDGASRLNSFVVVVEDSDEVWICVPTTGNQFPNRAYVWHTDGDYWSVRDLPGIRYINYGDTLNTDDENDPGNWEDFPATDWDTIDRPWNTRVLTVTDKVAIGVTDSKALAFGFSVAFDQTVLNTRLTRERLDFGLPEAVKVCRRVIPRIDAPADTGFTVRVGSQLTLQEPVVWNTFFFLQGVSDWVDCLVHGRYLSFEFESNFPVEWSMSGFQVEVEPRTGY